VVDKARVERMIGNVEVLARKLTEQAVKTSELLGEVVGIQMEFLSQSSAILESLKATLEAETDD